MCTTVDTESGRHGVGSCAPYSAGTTILLTAFEGAPRLSTCRAHHRSADASALGGGREFSAPSDCVLLHRRFILRSGNFLGTLATVPDRNSKQGPSPYAQSLWKVGLGRSFGAHPFVCIGANAFRVIVTRVGGADSRREADPAPPAPIHFFLFLSNRAFSASCVFCGCWAPLRFRSAVCRRVLTAPWIVSLAVWVVGVSS